MCLVKAAMLSSIIRKNVFRVDVRHLSTIVSKYTNDVSKNKHLCSGITEPNTALFPPNFNNNSRRNFSSHTDRNLSNQTLQFYKIVAILPFKFIINLLNMIIHLHIKRSGLEPDFDTEEFMNAAKYAVTVVSSALAQEDYKSLDGLVTPGIINELQPKISKLVPIERRHLAVNTDDVLLSYIGSVSWINEEDIKEIEIDVVVEYVPDGRSQYEQYIRENSLEKLVKMLRERVMYKFVFVRRYFNDRGEPWIITALKRLPPL